MEEGGLMGKVIAIDGPAGAGKSTVSKLLAKRLGFRYLDTGAMYRAITYFIIEKGININDKGEIDQLCKNINIDFMPPTDDGISHIFINDIDVTDKIRTSIVDKYVSIIAKIKAVRNNLIKIQKNIAVDGNIIMDGRDIGSQVLPDADFKFFVTASLDERARRRWLELKEKGINDSLEDIKKKISLRDKDDSEREISPLIKSDDAILVDTNDIDIQEVVNKMINIVKDEDNV